VTFLVASAAISGLPPFNGFVSEFLIYVSGFSSVRAATPQTVIPAIGIAGGLALIGGLAAACFAKAFGVIFLGEPRSDQAAHAKETCAAMRWPMAVLAVLCLSIGLLAPAALNVVLPAVGVVARAPVESPAGPVAVAIWGLTGVVYASTLLLLLVVALLILRRHLPRGTEETATGTWDCGYARPTPRMQYTAPSFAQPLINLFQIVLGTRRHGPAIEGFFPQQATFETHTPDAARERVFAPMFRLIDRSLAPIRRMQHGRIHEYLLYIAIVLVLLLIWKAGGRQ